MSSRAITIEEILVLLAETPKRIADLTANFSPVQLRTKPTSEEWSANEVLAHLRSCADVRGACIPRIITEDGPTLRAISPRTYMEQTDYVDLEFRTSFRAFEKQRGGLLAVLEPLPGKSWSRSAIVKGAGKPLEWTVLDYAEWIAVHERPHVKQIGRIVEGFV